MSFSATERKIVTRSKTGSLTPKQFTDSFTPSNTSLRYAMKANFTAATSEEILYGSRRSKGFAGSSEAEVLIVNKNGNITRVTRSATANQYVCRYMETKHFCLGKVFKVYKGYFGYNSK